MAGFREEVFGGKDELKFVQVPQSAEATAARKKQQEILQQGPPGLPTRKIAELPEQSAERQLARKTATDLAAPREKFDFASSPEVQAIIARTVEEGNLLANRIGRAQQKSGGFQTTTGRDVLGRTVKEIEGNISANLAQFAESERNREVADANRRQNLVGILENLGLVEEERERGTDQAKLDALFQQEFQTSQQTQNFILPLLREIIATQPGQQPTIKAGDMGILQQLDMFGRSAQQVNKTQQSSIPEGAGQAAGGIAGAFAASDIRVKDNIEPIEGALEKLNKLRGYTFNYKESPGERTAGVMAQDVEKVLPEAVVEIDGVKHVNYNAIIGLLVSAVNEIAESLSKE